MLEEFKGHLDDVKKKCDESEVKAKTATKLLGQVKNGVEHLTEKMHHIKAVSKHKYHVTMYVGVCINDTLVPVILILCLLANLLNNLISFYTGNSLVRII